MQLSDMHLSGVHCILVFFVENIVWFGVRGFTGESLGDFSRLFGIYTDRRWYASDRYGLLITVGGVDCVGGDFSQTAAHPICTSTIRAELPLIPSFPSFNISTKKATCGVNCCTNSSIIQCRAYATKQILYDLIIHHKSNTKLELSDFTCAFTCLHHVTTEACLLLFFYEILAGPAKSRNPRNPRNPPNFTKSSVFNRPIVSETYLNQQRQPLTSSDQRTLTVDEIEVTSSLNFSILIECSLLNACECVDFVSSTVFRRIR